MTSNYFFKLRVRLSKNEKQQKYSIILSQQLDFNLNFGMFTAVLLSCSYFYVRLLKMCKPRATIYLVGWAGNPEIRLHVS